MRSTPVDAQPTGIGSAAEKVEALQRRVEELEGEIRARDEFLAVVGHELRNPVAPVLLDIHRLLALVRTADAGIVAADAMLPRLMKFEQRLRRFVVTLNRILDVSRISAGKIDLVLEPVDFSEVVREVSASFQREIAAGRSELAVRAEGPLVGRWDRLRLEQICSNLLSNAIRYGAGEPIVITLRAAPGGAVLQVRDHGPGIALEDQQRIFERFERAGQPSTVGGFGVGLWVVSKLCAAFGGDVNVQSELGQGATFTVTLPRHEGTEP
jgi:signal transduction histidine kinase